MMFYSLFSGSSGNCSLIGNGSTKILVDCGVSGKKICDALSNIGEDIKNISAICITHEHIDHINSAGTLSRKYNIPVFANAGTWQGMENSIGAIKPENIRVFKSGTCFEVGDVIVESYCTYHDSAESVAYNFYINNKKYSILTDTGHTDDYIKSKVAGCEAILLEANHDLKMLKNGSYPYHLKYRIAGENGHLSNDAAGSLAVYLTENGTKKVFLGHLSAENNTEKMAFDAVNNALKQNNMQNEVELSIAHRVDTVKIFE